MSGAGQTLTPQGEAGGPGDRRGTGRAGTYC